MKQTTFTIDEKNLLQGLLKKRLYYYNECMTEQATSDRAEKKRFERFYVKPLQSALDKISKYETAIYNSKEKLACISCINEHFDDFYSELQMPTAFSWLRISDQQLNVVRKLDNCKDILFKCGYYNKKDAYKRYDSEFRYKNILTIVDKLKMSNKILLSKVGQNDFYKIAFVYENKEFLSFELKQQVTLRDVGFSSLNGQSPEDLATKKFSMLTTKMKAKELLATCDIRYYPKGVFDFLNELLN